MAGLIDVGILKPELAGSFAAGYRGAEKGRQEAEQARQQSERTQQQIAQGRQQMQMDEFTLQKLREDRAALTDLQAKLRSAGQSDDPKLFFQTLINTGNPDYMNKGYEGLQRYKELQQADQVLRQFAPEMFVNAATPAKPIKAMAPGALGSGTFGVMPEPINALAPKVTETPQPTNAMVAAPVADNAPDVNALRRQLFMLSSVNDPRAKAMADVIKGQITEASKPYVVGGRLVTGAGKELYTAPEKASEPSSLVELKAYMKMTPAEREVFDKLQKLKGTNVTATATSTTPTAKSLAAPVGARAETSLVKAEGAIGMMENANAVREALNTGNVIAGPLAGARTKFAQVLELAGAGDKEKLVATRNTIQGLASLTLESRAELKGQGQITDTETKLLERARSADIGELTIPELQQVVNVSQRLANRMWSGHQNLLKTMETDPAAADSLKYYRPTGALPQALGEGKPKAEVDKRKAGLAEIFGGKK